MITQKSRKIIKSFSEAVVREINSSEEINMSVDAYENYSNDHQICYNFAWNLFNDIQVIFYEHGKGEELVMYFTGESKEFKLVDPQSYNTAVLETKRRIHEASK